MSNEFPFLKLTTLLEENRPYLESIRAMLSLVQTGPMGTGTLIDYGCGTGPWSLAAAQIFEHVFGLDIYPPFLAHARDAAALNGFSKVHIIDALSNPELPVADAMISIDVVEVMRGDHVHQMFAFARDRLKPGGRFLLSSRRPVGLIDQLITLERFSYDGFYGGLRRYASITRSAIEAFLSPRIRNVPRGRFYWHFSAVSMLADEYGFTVETGPEALCQLGAFQHYDQFFKGNNPSQRRFRWSDWYVLRKV